MNATTDINAQLHATLQEAAEALEHAQCSDGEGLLAPDRQSRRREALLMDDPITCATAYLR